MSLSLTVAIAAGLLGVALFAGWRGARAPNPLKGPRLVPWRMIMLVSAAGLLPMIVHILNLLGVATGR